MNTKSTYKPHQQPTKIQWLIVILLLAIMMLTRSGFMPHIQDASWAVFFLIGFYYRSFLGLPFIIIAAVVIDFATIAARGGHQDYYLTPSYLFIVPAYAALWFAGRFVAKKYSESFKGLVTFLAMAVLGIIACDLISSGGFYWISSDNVQISFAEFAGRFIEFMPLYLKSTMMYLSIAAIAHMTIRKARKSTNSQHIHSA